MQETSPLIILGQTSVGKTSTAITLAHKMVGEIISADSMQVYRGMNIGTAKPSIEEREGIPHHLIDIKDPDEDWSVSDFVAEVKRLVPKICARNKTPIIAGGTGLYLWALLHGYSFPKVPEDKQLRKELESRDLTELYQILKEVDPASAGRIHPNDQKRIVRAIEVYQLTGVPISNIREEKKTPPIFSNVKIIGLDLPRELLYERINKRVDQMIEDGLIDEVKNLLGKGYPKILRSFQALGYKEVIQYLEDIWTKDQMIEELKKRTRNFARRQMTWFRRFENVEWIDV